MSASIGRAWAFTQADREPCEDLQVAGVPRAAARPRRAWPMMAWQGARGAPRPAGGTMSSRLRRCRGRVGVLRSRASGGIAACAGVGATRPSVAALPPLRELPSKRHRLRATMPAHEPRRSNRITSTRSPRRPRTMSRRPAQRSSPSVVSICAARETKPRRLSVMPAASRTRVPTGSRIAGPTVRGSAVPAHRGRRRPRSAACGRPRARHRSHHRRREHPRRRDAAVRRPPPRSPPAESPQAPPPPSRRARSADRAASRRRDPRSRRSFRTTRLTDTPGGRTRTRIVRLSASDRNRRPHQPPGASMRPTISRWTSSPP